MGAESFYVEVAARSVENAFKKVVKEAKHEHGNSGNTGTIAEKKSFIEIPLPKGCDPQEYAERLIKEADSRIYNPSGPAGCIHLGRTRWLFFGWAKN